MDTPEKPTQKLDAGLGDLTKYLVHSKTEIIYLLRAVMQKTELVTAYFNQGRDFFLTSLLAVEADHVVLDYGANEALNRKILESRKVVFLTSLERVRVQFTASRIETTTFGGRPAFRIPLPDSLLKLQRREYYRIATPIMTPLTCGIPRVDGGRIDVSIVDISVGGVGILGCPPELALEEGAIYPGCRITLPEIGEIVTDIQVRSIVDVTLRSGQATKRWGCQFVNLPANMQVLLQRYIIRLERERRARMIEE